MRTLAHGLNQTLDDPRDLQLGALTDLPALSELPESFHLTPLSLKDQGGSDFCGGFASTLLNEIEEGVVFSPEWQFAVAKSLQGNVEKFGVDLRDVLKSLIDYGSLPQDSAPFSLENQEADFLRRIENWPKGLFRLAMIYRKKTFLEVPKQYPSAYDNIRATIWKFRDAKQGVLSGLNWSWPISAHELDAPVGNNQGHCIPYLGWTPEGLVIQNSAGKEAGQDGIQLVTREVVDHCVEIYKAYMLIDLSREEVDYMVDHGIKLGDSDLKSLIKVILNTWLPFFNKFWKK